MRSPKTPCFLKTNGSPTSRWGWCYGFPTRLLALACKAGAQKDYGESEFFSELSKISFFNFLTIPNHSSSVWTTGDARSVACRAAGTSGIVPPARPCTSLRLSSNQYSPHVLSSISSPHAQVPPQNLHHSTHLISAPSSMP